MKRYLIHLGMFICGLSLILMSAVIGQSPGVIPATVSTSLLALGTIASAIVLILHAFDLGGPRA